MWQVYGMNTFTIVSHCGRGPCTFAAKASVQLCALPAVFSAVIHDLYNDACYHPQAASDGYIRLNIRPNGKSLLLRNDIPLVPIAVAQ